MRKSAQPKSSPPSSLPAVAVLGEILWDVLPGSRRLGGAPLNFAAQLSNLGHPVGLVSALGRDPAGREARARLTALGLDPSLVQTSRDLPTGTAEVRLAAGGEPVFTIVRPAAYDATVLAAPALSALQALRPEWCYFGTLFAARAHGRKVLQQMLNGLAGAQRFLDLNLRPGADSPALVGELLQLADVVKLNASELEFVSQHFGLPGSVAAFCRAAAERYGWTAVSVTLGARGCALLSGDDYVEADGVPVEVADTVGAGDAFAAALVHGLSRRWTAAATAELANRIAAGVASRADSLPTT